MSTTAVILAAGMGTRMASDLPKVLHEVCGRPMLAYVLDAARAAGCDRLLVVVGHRADLVRQTFAGDAEDIRWVLQDPQLGSEHVAEAARVATAQQRQLGKVGWTEYFFYLCHSDCFF